MMFSDYLDYNTLVEQIKRDDKIALRKIFNQFGMTLFLFSNALIKNKKVAEDIVSDSFISLWASRSTIADHDHLKSFLYRHVRDASLKYLLSTGQRIEFNDQVIYLENENYEQLIERIIFDDLIKIIFNEVENLPPVLAKVFKLSFIDGLSTQEVSIQLCMPKTKVLNNNRDAMHLLRNALLENDFALNLALLKMLCLGMDIR